MPRAGQSAQHFAIIGAGIAGMACARTLIQAGHRVTMLEKSRGVGGRMATRSSPFGTFDHGAQYFTVRDERFRAALAIEPELIERWSANPVRVLDAAGQVAVAASPGRDAHWVARPGMKSLVAGWARRLGDGAVLLQTRITRIERDPLNARQWQLRAALADDATQVLSGFDKVILAMPAAQIHTLLAGSQLQPRWMQWLEQVRVAPCWTLMLAFPQAMQPGLTTLGPHWHAARSTHHRIAWLARESSKPGRGPVERWTIQASAAWSQEHLNDQATRVEAKLRKAFAEITGIRAEPAHVDSQRWLYAQTTQALGRSHLWDSQTGLGLAGDWCLGNRVEDAFISGLELALAAL